MPDVIGLDAGRAVQAVRETIGSASPIIVLSPTKHGPIDIVEPDLARSESATVTSQTPSAGQLAKGRRDVVIFVGPRAVGEEVPPNAGLGWFNHPPTIEQNGAEPCFECHKETFCSDCHVSGGDGVDSEASIPQVNMLKGVGQKTLGLGSKTVVGMRQVYYRDDQDGPTFSVEVTAPQSDSVEEADRYFTALGKVFIDAVERAPRLNEVERIEFAWFQQGSDIAALREVYRRKPGGAFRRAVPYYEPNVSRFVN